jgi:HAD superfamily hydrolase (TIGR01509 family)
MIKLIIFDLDGVLFEGKKMHFDCLNEALSQIDDKYTISWDEHLLKYDGLKTTQKLQMLSEYKKLPNDLYDKVWKDKQYLTLKALQMITPSNIIIDCMEELISNGYKIACCSNSIRKTLLTVLSKLEIIQYFDLILSNEDVKCSKPHPQIYWDAMSSLEVTPDEVLIVEDSPYGLLAATRSGANILRVKSPSDVNFKNIKEAITMNINTENKVKWSDKKLNVLIPMAGAGSRFEKAGYTFPKPLIEVKGKPMIQVVIENLNLDANYIFVVQKTHREKYNLDSLLNLLAPNCKIVEVDGMTEGAACTALLAKEFIDNDEPLFFANSDQFVEWDSTEFMYKMQETGVDGGIVTFTSTHPKWSFAKIDNNGLVVEIAEKNPISDIATVGYYYWKHGKDFVKYAETMINKNIRVNDEFYVCPVFNQAISDNKKIRTFNVDGMWGLGTPEDLNFYLENYNSDN